MFALSSLASFCPGLSDSLGCHQCRARQQATGGCWSHTTHKTSQHFGELCHVSYEPEKVYRHVANSVFDLISTVCTNFFQILYTVLKTL